MGPEKRTGAAPTSSTHACNWPGCEIRVPRHIWGCRPHWFQLPNIYRHNLSRAWTGVISEAWTAANTAALEWIKQQQAVKP